MRLDHHARLARLLERHPDVVEREYHPARPCLLRRDQLLVSAADAGTLADRAARWVAGQERHDAAGVVQVHLRPEARVEVGELVADLAGDTRRRRLAVSPNHLLRGEPNYDGGPADEPQPPRTPPAPPPPPDPAPGRDPVSVAVLDTGLAPHPWFVGRDWYPPDPGTAEVLDANLDYRLDAQAGHGTFIAGVLLRGAPQARLLIRRVLGSDGVCDELALLRTLAGLHRHDGGSPDVVNLSLGGYTWDDRPSPLLAAALARFGRQTVFVAAAGNNASDRPFWPAALKSVVAVAALDRDGVEAATFTNYGWWVDACAVGELVTSSFVCFDGPQAAQPPTTDVDPDLFRGYATWSGTSFAAPVVAAAIAARAAADAVPAATAADRVLDPHGRIRPDLGVVVTAGHPS